MALFRGSRLAILSSAVAAVASDAITTFLSSIDSAWTEWDAIYVAHADHITQSGTVSQIDDTTGNGYHLTQGTEGNQPTWDPTGSGGGLGAIAFDGSNDYVNQAAFPEYSGGVLSFFSVLAITDTGTTKLAINFGNNQHYLRLNGTSDLEFRCNLSGGVYTPYESTHPDSTEYLQAVIMSTTGGGHTAEQDGGAWDNDFSANTDTLASVTNQLTLGGATSGAFACQMDFSFLAVGGGATPSGAAISSIESACTTYWGTP